MANLEPELRTIKEKTYGEEIRGAIYDGLVKINQDNEDATNSARAYANTAGTKASEAAQSAQTAGTKASEAAQSAQTAADKAEEITESARVASEKAVQATSAATAANTSKEAAEQSASDAADSANAAAQSLSDANVAKTAAESAANNAAQSEANALTYKNNAASFSDAAARSVTAAAASARNAAQSETNASNSASASAQSAEEAEDWAHKAEQAAGGGVMTFNNRSGYVDPDASDYANFYESLETAFNHYYGLVASTTHIDGNTIEQQSSEGEITTDISADGNTITTSIVPTEGDYQYVKTTTITDNADGTTDISTTYTREDKS